MNTTFATVAVFQYSSEAQIMKGRLEADAVQVFLTDNYTIDTDPLVSNAIGGVKLRVWQEDEKRALEIINSVNQYSVDDEGQPMACPSCGSKKVALISNITSVKLLFFFVISFLISVLPLGIKYEYRCENCNAKFNLNK